MDNTQNLGQPVGKVTTTYNGEKIQVNVYADRSVILPDGTVSLNNQVMDTPASKELPQLRDWLRDTIDRFGDKDPVIIKPDLDARHERVIDVLNAAAAAGVKNLTFS